MAVRRGVGCVVGLIVVASVASALGLSVAWYVVSREPSVPQNSTLVLSLATDLHESSPDDVLRQLLGGGEARSLRSVVDALRKAKVDKRVAAVLIVPSGLEAPYWGKIQEVREAILDFRKSGKPAIAYLEVRRRPDLLPRVGVHPHLPDADGATRRQRRRQL